MPRYSRNLTGESFGRWTVVSYAGKENQLCHWLCKCECGTQKKLRTSALTSGKSNSCGCLRKEMNNFWKKTHGMSNTPEFQIWTSMRRRCRAKHRPDWRVYGLFQVCKRWEKFENFIEDMGKRPSPKHSIERIENSHGYSPDNCKWATQTEQGRNRRTNHILTFDGRSQCIIEWAEEFNMRPGTLLERLRRGWTVKKAITTPVPSSC